MSKTTNEENKALFTESKRIVTHFSSVKSNFSAVNYNYWYAIEISFDNWHCKHERGYINDTKAIQDIDTVIAEKILLAKKYGEKELSGTAKLVAGECKYNAPLRKTLAKMSFKVNI